MKKLIAFILLIPVLVFSQEQIQRFDQKSRDSIIQKGRQAYFNKDTVLLKKQTEVLYTYFKNYNDSIALAKYYHFKALKTKIEFKQDSAYYYYVKSKNISKLIKDSLAVGRRLLSMGIIQRKVRDYVGSELSLIEAILYLEPHKSYSYLSSVYNSLGIVYGEIGDYEKSRVNYHKALSLNKMQKNLKRKNSEDLHVYNNIGISYQRQKNYKKAILYFEKGLKKYENINDSVKEDFSFNYALLLENLAYSNFSIGNYKNVIEKYFKVIEINKNNNNLDILSVNYNNIVSYYKEFQKIDKAKNMLLNL